MATNSFSGIFEQLGIDTRTQEQILASRVKARRLAREEALIKTPERFAGEHASRRAGQQLGDTIGKRFGGGAGQLEPDEQRTVDAMAEAQVEFEKQKAKGAYEDELAEGEGLQGEIANALIRAGDPRGVALAQQLNEQARARQEDEDSHVSAGLKDEIAQQVIDRGKRGKRATVVPQGSVDPADAVDVFIDPITGAAQTANGVEFDMGDYTTYIPKQFKAGRPLTAGDLGVPDIEAKALRQRSNSIQQQMRGAVRMKRALAKSIGEDGGVNIMDGSGKATTVVTKTLDFLSSTARQVEQAARDIGIITKPILSDGDFAGKNLQNPIIAKRFAKTLVGTDEQQSAFDIAMGDLVPKNLRKNATQRAVYYATLTQMVYARARTNEPGARQLSDADFRNAMVGLAGTVSNPEAFRQVMLGNIEADVQGMIDAITQLPDLVRTQHMVISKAGMDRFNDQLADFRLEFGEDFGTAPDPTQALLDSPSEEPAPVRSVEDIISTPSTIEDRRKSVLDKLLRPEG